MALTWHDAALKQEYQPDDPAVKALLTRDVSSAMKEPYKAAVEDCLIITMKGAQPLRRSSILFTSPPAAEHVMHDKQHLDDSV